MNNLKNLQKGSEVRVRWRQSHFTAVFIKQTVLCGREDCHQWLSREMRKIYIHKIEKNTPTHNHFSILKINQKHMTMSEVFLLKTKQKHLMILRKE